MTHILNGLPWKAEPDLLSHEGWRIIKTTAHYSDGVAASYMGEKDAKAVCFAVNTVFGGKINMEAQDPDAKAAQEEKQRLFDFIKNDIMPLVAQQSGEDSERARLCRLLYFVLRNRTVEHWGPRELTMADAMGLP